jgi:hypothetical protein
MLCTTVSAHSLHRARLLLSTKQATHGPCADAAADAAAVPMPNSCETVLLLLAHCCAGVTVNLCAARAGVNELVTALTHAGLEKPYGVSTASAQLLARLEQGTLQTTAAAAAGCGVDPCY